MGQAAQMAAREIKNQLLEVGAKKLDARIEDLELRDGAVWVRGVPDKRLSITEIFKARFGSSVGSMFGGHCFKTEGGLNPKTGKGKAAAFWFFSACGVEVEVDRETGKVRILRIVATADAGKAIHPKHVYCKTKVRCCPVWDRRFLKRWSMTTASRSTAIFWSTCCDLQERFFTL